jgi:hypothetical protein
MSHSRMSHFLASVLPGLSVSQADPVHAVSSTRHALVSGLDRCKALVCRGEPEPLLMQMGSIGVGPTAVGPSLRYDAHTHFGRAATVGPRNSIVGAIGIMMVALVLRTWILGGASLWSDEALTAL